jgi:hypothetical protein
MKPKKISRQLTLNKTTVVNLGKNQMNAIDGGKPYSDPPYVTCICQPSETCTCPNTNPCVISINPADCL